METPPSLNQVVRAAVVSPTLLAFAALMLLLPLYRLVLPYWPEPIVEHLLPDGRVLLRGASETFRAGGVIRSRPVHAARIEFADGRTSLAYVVAVRRNGAPATAPPAGVVWQPDGDDCEIATRPPNGEAKWMPCSTVVEVSKPNRMHLAARARLALQQSLPGWRIQP